MNNLLRLFLLCLGVGVSYAPILGQAQNSSDLRCLFLVNCSTTMASRKEAIANAVSARILNGLDGQMNSGDQFSIWTLNEAVSKDRYLPMKWTPRTKQLLAERISHSLRNQLFEGEPQIDRAIVELTKLALFSDSLTAVILTDARTISGTPFDDKINPKLRELQSKPSAENQLFVVTLVARSGRFVGWAADLSSATKTQVELAVQDSIPASRAPSVRSSEPPAMNNRGRQARDTAATPRPQGPQVSAPLPPTPSPKQAAPSKSETSSNPTVVPVAVAKVESKSSSEPTPPPAAPVVPVPMVAKTIPLPPPTVTPTNQVHASPALQTVAKLTPAPVVATNDLIKTAQAIDLRSAPEKAMSQEATPKDFSAKPPPQETQPARLESSPSQELKGATADLSKEVHRVAQAPERVKVTSKRKPAAVGAPPSNSFGYLVTGVILLGIAGAILFSTFRPGPTVTSTSLISKSLDGGAFSTGQSPKALSSKAA